MIESFEYKGLWWLPENQENKISGTLKFNPEEGPILELIGSFNELPELSAQPPPEIVLGITSNGKKITLYGYRGKTDQVSWPGLPTTTLKPKVIFVGHHFSKKEKIYFDSLSINYTYLEDWFFVNPFSIEWNLPKEYKLQYKYPKPIIAEIGEFKVSLESTLKTKYKKRDDIQIKHRVFIKLGSKRKHHFIDFMDAFNHIRNFICLGVKRPIYPTEINANTDENVFVMVMERKSIHQ